MGCNIIAKPRKTYQRTISEQTHNTGNLRSLIGAPYPLVMKYFVTVIAFVVLSLSLRGQEMLSIPTSKWQIIGIQFSGGPNHTLNYPGTFDQFQALARNTEILAKHPFEGYEVYPMAYWRHSGGIAAAVAFRQNRRNSAKVNGPLFRLGLRYQEAGHQFLIAGKVNYFPHDTLYNTNGDLVGYVDSVAWKRYDMDYDSYQLHLDFSMIYSTHQAHRVALYGGIGLSGGLSTRAWVRISKKTC